MCLRHNLIALITNYIEGPCYKLAQIFQSLPLNVFKWAKNSLLTSLLTHQKLPLSGTYFSTLLSSLLVRGKE